MKSDLILIGHGSGGRLTNHLIHDIFMKEFGNNILNNAGDSAILPETRSKLAFTTDSYVIDPVFFPGGDIGKLSICGTINDLCVSGAIPKYFSLALILEEGFPISQLKKIVKSIAVEAKIAGVLISTGDTKVVKRGQCDKIFINTSGIGFLSEDRVHLSTFSNIQSGDLIIISGTLGDHAIAILTERECLVPDETIESDVASLLPLTEIVLKTPGEISFMRDLTRGGLATVLNEICSRQKFGIEIDESSIPVKKSVKAISELYGFDPIYLANEGKMVLFVRPEAAFMILEKIKTNVLGKNAAIIGKVTGDHQGKVIMNTLIKGKRIVDMLNGEMLPRIC